jgi:tetratricopeptide (TPR) repeat protein
MTLFTSLTRFLLLSIIIILLTYSLFFTQRRLDTYRPGILSVADELKYLPSGTFLKGAALGFDEVLADLLWIKAIGYVGEHSKSDQDFTWLYHILDITTTLDPGFEDPYEMGVIVLASSVGDVDKAIKIGQKGIENVHQNHPRYWYLPFFTAFNYMYYKNDYLTAAKYLEQAASFPQSPKYLPLLVARLYANTEDPGIALPFLEEMLAQANTPELEANLNKRIKEIQVKQHLNLLSSASRQFLERTGRAPQHLQELTAYGLLKSLPDEPFGGQYEITENGAIQSTSQIDSMELHINPKKKGDNPLIFLEEKK